MKTKKKFYVVWKGVKPGIYTSWAECESVIKGYSNAKYKSFPNLKTAQKAYDEGFTEYWGTGTKTVSILTTDELAKIGTPISPSLCVDAACNTQTKVMEYQGVWLPDKSLAFQRGPFFGATNNIGEFLAVVHALVLQVNKSTIFPIYSDSKTAMLWVKNKAINSKSMQQGNTSEKINDLIKLAINWLENNHHEIDILKWRTDAWGEIPADFGRK